MAIGGNPYSYFFGMVSNVTLEKKVSKVKCFWTKANRKKNAKSNGRQAWNRGGE